MNQSIPKSEIDRSKNEIKYYQWVSFVLLAQALFFYFPRIIWRVLSIKAGLNIGDLVSSLKINKYLKLCLCLSKCKSYCITFT